MPDDLHKRIKTLAQEYGTSVTGLINTVMKDFSENEGIIALERRISDLEREIAEMKAKK